MGARARYTRGGLTVGRLTVQVWYARVPTMCRPPRVTAWMRTRIRPAGRGRRSTTAVRRRPTRTRTGLPATLTATDVSFAAGGTRRWIVDARPLPQRGGAPG